jgi:hypothetical protein
LSLAAAAALDRLTADYLEAVSHLPGIVGLGCKFKVRFAAAHSFH